MARVIITAADRLEVTLPRSEATRAMACALDRMSGFEVRRINGERWTISAPYSIAHRVYLEQFDR